LNIKLVGRILHGADRLNQSVNDELLIEDGQLHGHARQFVEVARRIRVVFLLILEIEVAHSVAMNTIKRQDDHDCEIGNEHGHIERVQAVGHGGERVGEEHFHVMAQAVLGSKGKIGCERHGRPMQLAGGGIQTVGKGGKQGEPPGSGYRQL